MVQPFRVTDQDDPGRDRGGWGETGNVDIPGTLTVDTIKGSQSSSPALTTVTFQAQVAFLAAVAFTATVLTLSGAAAADSVLGANVSGDAFDRFRLRSDGRLDWGAGTGARDTNLYRSNANELTTDDHFVMATGQSSGQFSVFGGTASALRLGTAGGGVAVAEGSNARMGTSTLVAGTVTVANTSVTANTRIFLTAQTSGAGAGALRISARTAGTSFTITSTSGTDTSSVAWLLMEPA